VCFNSLVSRRRCVINNAAKANPPAIHVAGSGAASSGRPPVLESDENDVGLETVPLEVPTLPSDVL
jgi:hypothetical protein